MSMLFWLEFFILFIAAIVGSIAILPYSLRLLESSKKKTTKRKLPKSLLLFLSILQNAILFAVVIIFGLLAAHAVGRGAPLIEAIVKNETLQPVFSTLPSAGIYGALAGLVLLAADFLSLRYLPKALIDTARKTTLWENFTASFYGGINEELLMRLFGVSVMVWVLDSFVHIPMNASFWTANILMAVLFGLGHLPATKALVENVTPFIVSRALLLNGVVGILCGWLFWQYGIEAAILAHFSADIIYHVGGTIVLKMTNK